MNVMNNSNAKFFFTLFICLSFALKGTGQSQATYSFIVTYNVPSTVYCWDGKYGWLLKGDKNPIDDQINNKTHYETTTETEFLDVPNYELFDFSFTSTCIDKKGESSCSFSFDKPIMAKDLILFGSSSLGGCNESVEINNFKPNVTIANSKSSNEICSGENLNLQAFPGVYPNKFPNEAYHWQYSFNGSSNWTDVPVAKNNTPLPSFSIYEIIPNHQNYFNTTIYFRLGYGQNRPFTDAIPIKYSPCGPTINSFTIEKPNCKGGNIQEIDVFFNDDLKVGETLNSIYLRKMEYEGPTNDNPPIFENTSDIVYSNKKHSIPIIDPFKLDNGMHYQIIYQTFLNGQPRGVLYSPIQQYLDPTAVTCSIKVPENILCSDGKTSIEITASGGTGSYYFYKDNVKLEGSLYPEVKNGKYYINNLIGDPTGKAYKILVTDTNGCYE